MFYLQPPLWADRSVIIQVRHVLPLLCLLASFSQLLHWYSPLHSLSFIASFTTINKKATHFRGTLACTQRALSLSAILLCTQLGVSGSLKPANWKSWAQEHLLGHVAVPQNPFKALAPFLMWPGCCWLYSARYSVYALNCLCPVFTEWEIRPYLAVKDLCSTVGAKGALFCQLSASVMLPPLGHLHPRRWPVGNWQFLDIWALFMFHKQARKHGSADRAVKKTPIVPSCTMQRFWSTGNDNLGEFFSPIFSGAVSHIQLRFFHYCH